MMAFVNEAWIAAAAGTLALSADHRRPRQSAVP